MIRNANYVLTLIQNTTGKAKKAQVGVDLTLNKVSRILGTGIIFNDDSTQKTVFGNNEIVELDIKTNRWKLSVGTYSVEFNEGLTALPINNTAIIYQRSSIARNGVLIRSSIYDPGFATPAIGAIMYVFVPIEIEKDSRVAQILIFENEEAALYNGQYLNLPGLSNQLL